MPTKSAPPTLKELEAAEKALRLVEQQQVLAQPHRNGSRSPLRSSALGRFVEDYRCGSLCFDAGEQYQILVYKWRKANGIPQSYNIVEFHGNGGDLDPNRIKEWKNRINDCNKSMATVGTVAYLATLALILDDKEPLDLLAARIKQALTNLGVNLGLIRE